MLTIPCSYTIIPSRWTAKRYLERIAAVSSVGDGITLSSREVIEWMHKIQEWNPKYFTLSHVPEKHRLYVTKFTRQVVIARMAEFPDLASAYHLRLRDAYDTEEKLQDPEVTLRSQEHLVRLLDAVETQLNDNSYLAGEKFTMADVMLIPVLARLVLLKLEHEYIDNRPNISEYWKMVQQRPSYKRVIGKYFDGWRRQKTLTKTWCYIHMRNLLKKY
ncbi:hypothetical protein BVRB_1g010190 isoform B [Beta vulgaris subsp. vulgaris]|nr:hypothetical protein BVRB_1g010190 isoform B [Beta vulgaris subsp. vulgaris]